MKRGTAACFTFRASLKLFLVLLSLLRSLAHIRQNSTFLVFHLVDQKKKTTLAVVLPPMLTGDQVAYKHSQGELIQPRIE